MSIGGINTMGNATESHLMKTEPIDSMSKSIENEISDIQRQRQHVLKEDISADEKQEKRRKLQQEISRLNAQLKQHQSEMRREHNKDEITKRIGADDSRLRADEDKNNQTEALEKEETEAKENENKAVNEKEEKKVLRQEQSVIATSFAMEQAKLQSSVVSGIKNDITVMKGEIKLDSARGENVEDKRGLLDKSRNRLHRASDMRFGDSVEQSDNSVDFNNTNYAKDRHEERQNFNISFG